MDVHACLYADCADTSVVADIHYENGSDRAFKDVTACIVTPDLRPTNAAEPITTTSDHLPKIVDEELGKPINWVSIRRVSLDWGYYQVWIIPVLERLRLKDVGRVRRFPSRDDGKPTVRVGLDYPMRRRNPTYDAVTVNRSCVPHAHTPG